MAYIEIIVSFLAGLILVVLAALVFSFKTKGVLRLVINSVTGGLLLVGLTLFKVVILPLNPLNAFITGIFGLPGLITVYLIAVFA